MQAISQNLWCKTSKHIRLLGLVTFSLLITGCGDPGPMGPQEIEVGTGALTFESLNSDQELVLINGTQGGWHFVVNARVRGLLTGDPDQPGALGNPRTLFSMYLEDGTQIDSQIPPYRLGYRDTQDGWFGLPSGRILQLDQSLGEGGLIPDIYGQRVRIRARVKDASDLETEGEVWIRVLRDDET